MKFFNLIISILTLTFFAGCASNEVGNSKDVNPDAIYFEYKIWANEKDSLATVYLQYRMGGHNGTTLVLNDPAKVQFDGEEIHVDSAKLSGAYYEIQKPLRSFAGEHNIFYKDQNNKEYTEKFSFKPFSLKTNIPSTVKRSDLPFDFEGLEPVDYLRVFATDTSFASVDINETDTVKNGRVIITKNQLNNLVNGPVALQFFKEEERPLKNTTKTGGKIFISYSLQRRFELKD
jgi:hypothetical protein